MPIKQDLLEILICPKSKQPLQVVGAEAIATINQSIEGGSVKYEDGSLVKEPLQEALVTADRQRLYAVKDSIPIMLIDESIPTAQLGEQVLATLPAG